MCKDLVSDELSAHVVSPYKLQLDEDVTYYVIDIYNNIVEQYNGKKDGDNVPFRVRVKQAAEVAFVFDNEECAKEHLNNVVGMSLLMCGV